MDIKSTSLMQKLSDLMTANNLSNTSGILANYMLLHYHELEQISLNQVVSDCYVSVSSVRRFCQKLGYENYSDLVDAKTRNPENQQDIAIANVQAGLYDPAVLRNEINENLYLFYRSISQSQIREIAEKISHADVVLLICTRPYNFWLKEFQNQLIAWGKSTYILEEPTVCYDFSRHFTGSILSIMVSPLAILPKAYCSAMEEIPGEKILIACPSAVEGSAGNDFVQQYCTFLPLRFKLNRYEYMEIYGKYTIGYLFDILLGAILSRMIWDSRSSPSNTAPRTECINSSSVHSPSSD